METLKALAKRFLAVLLAIVLQQTVYRRLRDRLLGMPPGPMPLPLIGNFNLLSEPNKPPGLHKDFWRLAKQFGPIYTLYFGANRGVVLNSKELWYEALNTKQDQTAQRPQLKSFESITHFDGVAMNNGKRWKSIRTVLQKSVTNKQLGEKAEPLIMEELDCTLTWLRQQCEQGKGAEFDLRQLCRRESLNVAMRKIFSFRFKAEMTPEYMDTQDWIRVIFEHLAQGSPSDFMPILAIFPDPGKKEYLAVCKRMHDFLEHELQRHRREEGKRVGDMADFMDIMIAEQKAAQANKEEFVMTDMDIKVCAWDMMAGAIDTSATSMEWLIYILCNRKDVQDKMHAVLDEVVGPNRLPTLADLPNLKYCTAVLDENFRWKHFAPQGLPHEASEDLTLGGYNIPKGTQIFLNFYSLHMNPDYWVKPNEFRPERFLDEKEDAFLLDTILHGEMFFSKPEAYKFVPFGQGKRRCVGYGLGRIVMWLKMVTWIHCFEWKSADGQPCDLDTEYLGITLVPKLQKVKAIPRPAAKLLKGESALRGVESR